MDKVENASAIKKQRPLRITKEQRTEILSEISKEIIRWQLSDSSLEQIISDLDKIYDGHSSGFEMARNLEDSFNTIGYYRVNSQLVELLEGLDYLSIDKKRQNIKDWVQAHNIQPKLKKGEKVKLKLAPFFAFNVGDEVYVNYLKEDTAHYVIDKDPNRKGGVVVDYEKLERCI